MDFETIWSTVKRQFRFGEELFMGMSKVLESVKSVATNLYSTNFA